MNGVSMPTEEEQFEVYKRAAVICKNKVLTIRTLDIGGDKDIPYMGLTKESNPFLGYRAIRFCLAESTSLQHSCGQSCGQVPTAISALCFR